MRRTGRQIDAETELMHHLPALREQHPGIEDCPHRKLLKQFLDGKVLDENVQNRILRHLDCCQACVGTLKELRDSRILVRRSLLAAAAILLLAVLIWFWPAQRSATETATVEFPGSEVLRGVEEPQLTLPRSTKRLHIILSGEGQPGAYELRLLKSEEEAFPLIEAQGLTHREKQTLELNVDFNISRLSSGDYVLALRRSSSSWHYRPIRIE